MADYGRYALLAAAALSAFVLFAAAWWTLSIRRAPRDLAAEMDDVAFVEWLMLYERSYTRSSEWSHRALAFCQITPIVIGFIIAIVSALKDDSWTILNVSLQRNIVIIALTGVSTVCVAILTRMGVAQLARTRELGRINCAALVTRARLYFSINHTPQESYAEKVRIKDEIYKIEHDQAALSGGIAIDTKQPVTGITPRPAAQPQPQDTPEAADAHLAEVGWKIGAAVRP
jgi:hypothetical protein